MDADALGPGAFEVEYVDEDRIRHRVPLRQCWTERFDRVPPVRMIRAFAVASGRSFVCIGRRPWPDR